MTDIETAANALNEVHKSKPQFEQATSQKVNQLKESYNRSLEKAKLQAQSIRNELDKMQNADEDLNNLGLWVGETEKEVAQLFESQLASSNDWVEFEAIIKVSLVV